MRREVRALATSELGDPLAMQKKSSTVLPEANSGLNHWEFSSPIPGELTRTRARTHPVKWVNS